VLTDSNFHRLMRDLAHEVDAGRLTAIEAAGKVAEVIQRTLQCRHVTFWRVSGPLGSRVMRSIAAYDGVRRTAVAGAAAFPESGGGFFGALVRQGCYVCPDTFADPALQGVRETMLVPFGIHALLAASYGGNGEVWGVITCTNDTVRHWRPKEIAALRKCAAEVSALMMRRRALGSALLAPGGAAPT
jgi:hypothetical protein